MSDESITLLSRISPYSWACSSPRTAGAMTVSIPPFLVIYDTTCETPKGILILQHCIPLGVSQLVEQLGQNIAFPPALSNQLQLHVLYFRQEIGVLEKVLCAAGKTHPK